MVSIRTVHDIALSFPDTDAHPHFERIAFRVKKKIFVTLSEKDSMVMVKLSLIDQSVFCAFDPAIIYPVPGAWGKGGATFINLKKIKKSMLKDAITMAYCNVAPQKLADKFLPK